MKWKEFNPKKQFFVYGKPVKLAEAPTEAILEDVDKEKAAILLQAEKQKMCTLQEVLLAEKRHAVWVIIQAMDAAGKDSAIEHVFTGLNPQGVEITSFKTPTQEEYSHDFLWRHLKTVPSKGKIGVHNRSHYEFLTTCKIHPAYNLSENLPFKNAPEDFDETFFEQRLDSVKNMEKYLSQNGVTIIKLFLHISKEEQKSRFLDRINQADKNWKFNAGDLKERILWEKYEQVFESIFEQTSTKNSPWYIIPADKKWYARLAIAKIVNHTLESLKMTFPKLTEEEKAELERSKQQLLNEKK